MFLNQVGAPETELIIYNTDVEYPLILAANAPVNIRVVNCGTDQRTGAPYKDLGSVRRDSLAHASGKYYICWDDDDIFMPWHIRQCLDGMTRHPHAWGWKPYASLFWPSNGVPEIARNNMEASILVDLAKLRETGFSAHQGGGEHLHWLDTFRKLGRLIEDRKSIPSYCFNWHDHGVVRGHKQSGTINRPDNFEYHKTFTQDYAKGTLDGNVSVENIYVEHLRIVRASAGLTFWNDYTVDPALISKYIDGQ
jgi:hypothetical protein